MCSMHSAMDHVSCAGLKFHCASLSPLVAASTPFLLLSSKARAFSLSAALASCARAVPVTARQNAAAASTPIHLRRFMWFSFRSITDDPPQRRAAQSPRESGLLNDLQYTSDFPIHPPASRN